MYSSTDSFDSSLVLNDSGSSSTSPSRLPRILVEYQPCRPSIRALRPGAMIVFISVWPVLKSLPDRKSTRLNSSHANISYAVFCLKKKKKLYLQPRLHSSDDLP